MGPLPFGDGRQVGLAAQGRLPPAWAAQNCGLALAGVGRGSQRAQTALEAHERVSILGIPRVVNAQIPQDLEQGWLSACVHCDCGNYRVRIIQEVWEEWREVLKASDVSASPAFPSAQQSQRGCHA